MLYVGLPTKEQFRGTFLSLQDICKFEIIISVISLSVLQDVKAKCHVTVFCNCMFFIIVIFPFNSRFFYADTSLWRISPKSFENLSDLQYL